MVIVIRGSGLRGSRPACLLTAVAAGASHGSLGDTERGFSF